MKENKIKPALLAVLSLTIGILVATIAPCNVSYDATIFMFPWLKNMKLNGVFSMYKQVADAPFAVDYPPLYYSSMFLTVGSFVKVDNFDFSLIFIRLFPVIVNIFFVYFIAKHISPKWAMFYMLFPSVIIGTAIMGQSDMAFLFLIFLFFYFYYEKKDLYLFSVTYALMVCLKLQGIYFLPIFLFLLFTHESPKERKRSAFLIGVLLGFIIWLPWLIAEGLPIFFKVYLGSASQELVWGFGGNFPFMFTAMLGLTDSPDSPFLVMLYNILNYGGLLLCVLIGFKTYKKTGDVLYSTAIYLFYIFMLTMHQYERYEIYAWGVLFFIISTNFKYSNFEQRQRDITKKIFWLVSIANICHFVASIAIAASAANQLFGILAYTIAFMCNLRTIVYTLQMPSTEEKAPIDID